MVARILCVLLVIQLLVLPGISFGQKQLSDAEKAANTAGWDDAWAWGNAFAAKTYFEQLYYPHAKALLDAEKQTLAGRPAQEIAKELAGLPGVRGTVVARSGGTSAQFPENTVRLEAFNRALFKDLKDRHIGSSLSPMMRRTVGGKVRFAEAPTASDTSADLLVRYLISDTTKLPADAIALIMDRTWLVAQIPSAMDSLYRENVQLLFAAASPQNKHWEQSLGIIADKDTLWWVGRKDVKIANEQILWPFESIKVASYFHTLEKK